MSRSSHRARSTAATVTFIVIVLALLGGISQWTALPDGFVGFLAVMAAAFWVIGGGSTSRRSRPATRRRYRRH